MGKENYVRVYEKLYDKLEEVKASLLDDSVFKDVDPKYFAQEERNAYKDMKTKREGLAALIDQYIENHKQLINSSDNLSSADFKYREEALWTKMTHTFHENVFTEFTNDAETAATEANTAEGRKRWESKRQLESIETMLTVISFEKKNLLDMEGMRDYLTTFDELKGKIRTLNKGFAEFEDFEDFSEKAKLADSEKENAEKDLTETKTKYIPQYETEKAKHDKAVNETNAALLETERAIKSAKDEIEQMKSLLAQEELRIKEEERNIEDARKKHEEKYQNDLLAARKEHEDKYNAELDSASKAITNYNNVVSELERKISLSVVAATNADTQNTLKIGDMISLTKENLKAENAAEKIYKEYFSIQGTKRDPRNLAICQAVLEESRLMMDIIDRHNRVYDSVYTINSAIQNAFDEAKRLNPNIPEKDLYNIGKAKHMYENKSDLSEADIAAQNFYRYFADEKVKLSKLNPEKNPLNVDLNAVNTPDEMLKICNQFLTVYDREISDCYDPTKVLDQKILKTINKDDLPLIPSYAKQELSNIEEKYREIRTLTDDYQKNLTAGTKATNKYAQMLLQKREDVTIEKTPFAEDRKKIESYQNNIRNFNEVIAKRQKELDANTQKSVLLAEKKNQLAVNTTKLEDFRQKIREMLDKKTETVKTATANKAKFDKLREESRSIKRTCNQLGKNYQNVLVDQILPVSNEAHITTIRNYVVSNLADFQKDFALLHPRESGDSTEYKNMINAVNTVKSSIEGKRSMNAIAEELKILKSAADTYITEKNKEKFVLGTGRRVSRLTFADNIVKFCDKITDSLEGLDMQIEVVNGLKQKPNATVDTSRLSSMNEADLFDNVIKPQVKKNIEEQKSVEKTDPVNMI